MSSQATAGAEMQVNTVTTGHQNDIALADLADGGWIVTYRSTASDGYYDILQQRYDALGHQVGTEAQINVYTTMDQYGAATTGLADGGWIVTWTSPNQDGTNGGVFMRRYDADGIAAAGDIQVNVYTTSSQDRSQITALDDGGWVVTWQSFNQAGVDSLYDIYQQRYTSAGTKVGTETVVNTTLAEQQSQPAIATLAKGGWVVAWESTAADTADYGIFMRRYNASGVALTSDVQVSTFTNGYQADAAITALSGGGWVVTWSATYENDEGVGIYQRVYAKNGAAIGDEIHVNTAFTTGQQTDAEVAGLADGGWVVVWSSESHDSGDVNAGVYQQRYDASGKTVGGETLVNVTTNGVQNVPAITAFADGGWTVSWASDLGGAFTGAEVMQRHYATDVLGTAANNTLAGTDWSETIRGLGGNDRLGGKLGDDIMIGATGNDVYIVNSKGDSVQELAKQGTDRIDSTISLSLAGVANVENLTLKGSANLKAIGNTLDNVLTGNIGGNAISGGIGDDRIIGGRGNDMLTGGDGHDIFVFRTGDDKDLITDFHARASGHDVVDLKAMNAIKDFADLKAYHMTAAHGDVIINAGGGDIVTLDGVKLSDVNASDFLF